MVLVLAESSDEQIWQQDARGLEENASHTSEDSDQYDFETSHQQHDMLSDHCLHDIDAEVCTTLTPES